MPIRAFLFDFDGLIVDTETASRAGWRWLYAQHGHSLPDELWIQVVGTHGGWDVWGHLEGLVGAPLDREDWNAKRYEHELSLLEAEELRPGVLEYLAYAGEHGLKRAIVSSSSRTWIDMHLERLEQAFGWDAIITADRDSSRAKPNPAMYLEALDALGVAADEAVVFEDSRNGVAAANAAGIFVVGVPNAVTRAFGLEEADLVVDSLADLPPGELLQRAARVGYDRRRPTGGEMSAYRTARLDEITAEKWPYWAPVRHHFGIETFGVNAWRGGDGDRVITPHNHAEDGSPELYVVISGAATFTIAGESVDAPAVTFVLVEDASADREAHATADGTVVLAIGAAKPGEAYAPQGWDTNYLEGGD